MAAAKAPADLLVLPHHGRPTASAAALLDAVAPTVCLVSNRCGEGISAGGELARQRGLPVYATGRDGDLHLEIGEAGVRLRLVDGLRVR